MAHEPQDEASEGFAYLPERAIWTQDDFDQMGWHDATLHGLAIHERETAWGQLEYDLLCDIDYLFQWVKPVPPSRYFSFWVSPCTLEFRDVSDLAIKMDGGMPLTISGLELVGRQERRPNDWVYEWRLEFHYSMDIRLKSHGFEQVVRAAPVHSDGQSLDQEKRGGISYGMTPYRIDDQPASQGSVEMGD